MTRTVEMARLYPMPGDVWKRGKNTRTIWKLAETGWPSRFYVGYIECGAGDMTLAQFRRWVAGAIPVRVFEGEAGKEMERL